MEINFIVRSLFELEWSKRRRKDNWLSVIELDEASMEIKRLNYEYFECLKTSRRISRESFGRSSCVNRIRVYVLDKRWRSIRFYLLRPTSSSLATAILFWNNKFIYSHRVAFSSPRHALTHSFTQSMIALRRMENLKSFTRFSLTRWRLPLTLLSSFHLLRDKSRCLMRNCSSPPQSFCLRKFLLLFIIDAKLTKRRQLHGRRSSCCFLRNVRKLKQIYLC